MNTAKVTSAKEKKVIDFNGKKAAYILLDIPSDGKTVEAYYFIHNGNIYVIQCKYYSTAIKDELAFYHDIMSTLVFK